MSSGKPHEPDARVVFEILVQEHADMLEAYLRSLVASRSNVDDLFQETMLVAWRRLADFDRSRPFGAWLRGIAQILVLEQARKARARPLSVDPGVLSEIDRRFDLLARAPGETFSERAERLLACLDRLPVAMREAIELVYARSLSIVAAAELTGATVESLKKRVQRARQTLAECLGEADGRPKS